MAKVKMENLTKNFGKVVAVKNLNVTVEDGEFLSLLGPSGCGKTTTLRMAAGLEYPSSGSIYFDEVDVTDFIPAERDISMVFENYALFPHMSVYGNVSYSLKVQKPRLSRAEIDKKVLAALKLVNIQELINRMPRQLSGGQQQRVAIARAIVRAAKVYLYDEPISHLDAKLRARMRGELKRLQKDLGITTIFVTHDQLEALSMADKIVVLNFGEAQQIGTSHQLYDTPYNTFVASFIGTPEMNFLECELKEEGGQALLVSDYLKLPISRELMEKIDERKTDSELLMGCRPIDLILRPEANSDKYPIKGNIFIYEPLGVEQIIQVQLGVNQVQVIASADLKVEINDPVYVEVPEGKFYVFDKTSGLNISI